MPGRSRHPKKDIEAALRIAEEAGWTVAEIHRDIDGAWRDVRPASTP